MSRVILLIIIPLIGALIVTVVYLMSGRYVDTDNAYVRADKLPVSSEVSGTIKEVLVRENQAVAAGQLLFRIDPAQFLVAVSKAQAKVDLVRIDLAGLEAVYREMQAEIALERIRHTFALKYQLRQADLVRSGFISTTKFDYAKQEADIAAQHISKLDENLKRIAVTLGGRVDVKVEHHPSYLGALADLTQAKLDLARADVRASFSGTVSRIPRPGQFLRAGNTAMVLVANDSFWVEGNFVETDLTYVEPGQPVTIHLDSYPNEVLRGVVESLSPATVAEFSVIPAQNTSGNWVKIAQRVPVRIKLADTRDVSLQLRTGLSATLRIDTGRRHYDSGFSQ